MQRKLPYVWLFFLCLGLLLSAFSSYAKTPQGKVDPIIGKRTIKVVNLCPFPVWFGFISGATPKRGGGNGCATDADCFDGSVCVDRGAGGKQCFWKTPIPANGSFQLTANGGTNSVDIPIFQNSLNSAWSGAAAGRTNCTTAGCETGDCGAGTGGCPAGRGFAQPTTQAEFTFNNTFRDFYDISLVNGMSIPVEMAPDVSGGSSTDPYYCGNPGGVVTKTQVGRCTWNMQPPSNDYKLVTKGGPACTTDSTCQTPYVCGLSFDPTKEPKLQKTCGKLIGYLNGNQVCGMDPNHGAPFNCQQQLPSPNQAFKMFHLLGCSPIPSCYQDGAQNNCCGCIDWDKVGIDVPPAPKTQPCKNTNPFWNSNVQPGLSWLKKACPTAYTYPFDDMSSTFTCESKTNNLNLVNYVITFCPGGQTGGMTG